MSTIKAEYVRPAIAVSTLMAYGALCAVEFNPNTTNSRLVSFLVVCFVIGILSVMVSLQSMIERAIIMAIIGTFIAATGVGLLILFVVFMLRLLNMVNRFDKFLSRLPFMLTSSIVYLGCWFGTSWLWPMAQEWPFPIWVSTVLVGLAGIALVLLIASVCALFGVGFTTAILETFVWGWYLVLFLILTFSSDDADDGVEWGR